MKKLDITIRQGSTWELPVMWETNTLVYKPITGIAQSSPVRLTVPNHGMPDGWNGAVVNVLGMTQINAASENGKPPIDADFLSVTLVSGDEIEFNAINSARFKPYASGGQLVYYAPGDLVGATARMQIKDKVGGTVLHTLRSDGAEPNIVFDLPKNRIIPRIEASEAAAFAWKAGVYDLEIESATGVVVPLLYGAVTLIREVTTL